MDPLPQLIRRYLIRAVVANSLLCSSVFAQSAQTAPPNKEVPHSPTALCQVLVDRYRPLAHANSGEPPLSVLVRSPKSGVLLTSKGEDVSSLATDVAAWAAAQQPPYSISPELVEALQTYALSGNEAQRMKAPGVEFYTLTRMSESMACSNSRSFVVRDGAVVPAQTPGESGDDDDASCSQGVRYGTIDGSSVAMVQSYDWRPGIGASIDVWTWAGHGFTPACSVSLQYKPHFSRKTFNTWREKCTGNDCDSLRDAAFKLAAFAEAEPEGETLKAKSIERLKPAQREQFKVMEQIFAAERRDPPATDPFSIPFLHHGRLYVASVGHFEIGWREYADWSVVFATLENGKLTPRGEFAVGTWKGALESASVSEK